MSSIITGLASYVPERVMTNADFEKLVETSDEWIVKRTGIKERRRVTHETTVEMAKLSALEMMKRYNKDLSDVDFIIFASCTGEHKIPSLASQLQYELGIPHAGSFDLTAACAGFVYALNMAQALILSGFHKKILVATAEVLTRYTDYTDRSSCILFGDGAATALVEAAPGATSYRPVYGTEGEQGHSLYCTNMVDKLNNIPIQNHNLIVQDGKKVFKWAVERMTQKFNELLTLNNLTLNDIDFFIPHSANQRIIEAICHNVGVDKSKSLQSIVNYGNTSAVSIPLALDSALKQGIVKKGSKLVLLGFGGGLTYAGAVVDWMI